MRGPNEASFSAGAKAEICGRSLPACCRASLLYGLLLFGRKYALSGIELTTENADVALLASRLLADCFGIAAQPVSLGKRKLRVSAGAEDSGRILDAYGSRHGGRQINYAALDSSQESGVRSQESAYGKPKIIGEPVSFEDDSDDDTSCCYRAFLAGVFLVCGSIGEPSRQYHLEFAVPFQRLADSLARFLEELGYTAKPARRGEHGNIRVLYFKDNEKIADLLGLMGAVDCSLALAEVAIEKTLRNKVNRLTNSDTANLNRAAAAAVRQLNAVRVLERSGQLEELPAALRDAAALRAENPEASLTELCALSGGVTRSSLYTRLKKLEQLAVTM